MNKSYVTIFGGVVLFLMVIGAFFYINKKNDPLYILNKNASTTAETIQISGWVPYWAEKESYDFLNTTTADIKTVSPVWFLVNDKFAADFVGILPKETIVATLHKKNISVIPTVSSDLAEDQFSPLFDDPAKSDALITDLVTRNKALGADGIDLDLEQIAIADKAGYVNFIKKLATACKEQNLKFVISAHAQTGSPDDWDGVKGEDLKAIGETADEVRIMAYDFHGPKSGPGAITPIYWLKQVIDYTKKNVPNDKIVIGLPTYGYLWEGDSTDPEPLQFNEFKARIASDKNFVAERDPESGEMQYVDGDKTVWVSDAESVQMKVKTVRDLGLNKFIYWNLGGIDDSFFIQK